jgi:hypothetical protein
MVAFAEWCVRRHRGRDVVSVVQVERCCSIRVRMHVVFHLRDADLFVMSFLGSSSSGASLFVGMMLCGFTCARAFRRWRSVTVLLCSVCRVVVNELELSVRIVERCTDVRTQLNASDNRRIDDVREIIKEFASTRTITSSGFKLIILDEVDAMVNAAQAALRRGMLVRTRALCEADAAVCAVMEKYTRNTRFCLICNYASKIIPALQSRCTRFRFAPLDPLQMQSRVEHVISSERFAPAFVIR